MVEGEVYSIASDFVFKHGYPWQGVWGSLKSQTSQLGPVISWFCIAFWSHSVLKHISNLSFDLSTLEISLNDPFKMATDGISPRIFTLWSEDFFCLAVASHWSRRRELLQTPLSLTTLHSDGQKNPPVLVSVWYGMSLWLPGVFLTLQLHTLIKEHNIAVQIVAVPLVVGESNGVTLEWNQQWLIKFSAT